MFKRSKINRDIIESDEGFSAQNSRGNGLIYVEGTRLVNVFAERLVETTPMMINGEIVGAPSMMISGDGNWKWDSGEPIDDVTKNKIIENIRRAYKSQGITIAWQLNDRSYVDGKSTFPGDW